MDLIWEISGHAAHQNAWNFGARLFCKNIKKSGFNYIYNIEDFQDTYSQNGFFRKCFSHPTRPPVRPSWITSYQTGSCSSISQFRTESKWFVFQYFSVQNLVKLVRVPVFLTSKLSRNGSCSSISQFTGYQSGSCSSISQFKTESKWFVFQYFSVQNWLEWFVFQYLPNSN